MAVNTLQCSRCGRGDFDSVQEFETHDCPSDTDDDHDGTGTLAIADGGGLTRTCEDCQITWLRTDLVVTDDGALVCPECGGIHEIHAALKPGAGPYVLVPANRRSNHGIGHAPSEDHPITPSCNRYDRHASAYKPHAVSRLPDDYQLCAGCAGTDGRRQDTVQLTRPQARLRALMQDADPVEVQE